MVLAHSRDLPAVHGGFDGPGDEKACLAAVGGGGGQEAGLLIADEAADAGVTNGRHGDIRDGIHESARTPLPLCDLMDVGQKCQTALDGDRL